MVLCSKMVTDLILLVDRDKASELWGPPKFESIIRPPPNDCSTPLTWNQGQKSCPQIG